MGRLLSVSFIAAPAKLGTAISKQNGASRGCLMCRWQAGAVSQSAQFLRFARAVAVDVICLSGHDFPCWNVYFCVCTVWGPSSWFFFFVFFLINTPWHRGFFVKSFSILIFSPLCFFIETPGKSCLRLLFPMVTAVSVISIRRNWYSLLPPLPHAVNNGTCLTLTTTAAQTVRNALSFPNCHSRRAGSTYVTSGISWKKLSFPARGCRRTAKEKILRWQH